MKFVTPRSLIALLLSVAALTAQGQQYRWVDEKGRVQYTDTPPPPTAKDVQRKNFKGNTVGAQPSYELSRAIREAPVTLYTHPICKEQCQLARDVLNKRGVPFSEVVADNSDRVDQLKQVSGGTGVPVLVVGGQVEKMVSAEAYNRALDIAGYPPAGVAPARTEPQADKR
jgi:glutaredoxin